jgi:hypothetical protein
MGVKKEALFRLAGNSIPINTMKAVLRCILSAVDPSQIPKIPQ